MNWITDIWWLKNWVLPIIDILAVSFLIYQFYKIISGTRALLALRGIVLIILIFLISKLFYLQTLNWLISYVINFAVIALIVIFQPELRRILTQIGQNPVWGFLFKSNVNVLIPEIIEAVKNLSHKKIGALIVMKRETDLTKIIETGIKIDAIVSNELILSIFNKKSPIHDGAIIVENDRIIAAGCFLPLSEDENISKNFGTRHRAALGLSEESDALVIVVSEETGNISVAVQGKLKCQLKKEELKKYLEQKKNEN